MLLVMRLSSIFCAHDLTNLTGGTVIFTDVVSSEAGNDWSQDRIGRRLAIWKDIEVVRSFSDQRFNIALNTPARKSTYNQRGVLHQPLVLYYQIPLERGGLGARPARNEYRPTDPPMFAPLREETGGAPPKDWLLEAPR